MSRALSLVGGWALIVVAVLCVPMIPIKVAQGSASGGSVSAESDLFHQKATGVGTFAYEERWSVAWPPAVAGGIALCGGLALLLLRQRSGAAVRTA